MDQKTKMKKIATAQPFKTKRVKLKIAMILKRKVAMTLKIETAKKPKIETAKKRKTRMQLKL